MMLKKWSNQSVCYIRRDRGFYRSQVHSQRQELRGIIQSKLLERRCDGSSAGSLSNGYLDPLSSAISSKERDFVAVSRILKMVVWSLEECDESLAYVTFVKDAALESIQVFAHIFQ
jgi:hypothetical protein